MLYKITPFVFNLPSDVLLHYLPCSPGFTPLLFHLLLPLALSRLPAPLYPVTHHTRARWTFSSLSHCRYRSHLIPFTILIFPVVTSLLLLYIFKVDKESKAYNQAALCSRCRSRVNFYKASFPTAFWRQSDDWKKVPIGAAWPACDTLGLSTVGKRIPQTFPALTLNISICCWQPSDTRHQVKHNFCSIQGGFLAI